MGNNASKKQAAEKHNYHNDWRAAIREDRKRYPEKYGFYSGSDSAPNVAVMAILAQVFGEGI